MPPKKISKKDEKKAAEEMQLMNLNSISETATSIAATISASNTSTSSKNKNTNKAKSTNANANANANANINITKSFTNYLVIVESPSKCKKIEEFLGKNYKCIATKGHLREIEGLKSINTKGEFEIQFNITQSKKKHIESMREIIAEYHYTNIFLASDDDREGEAISWHVCELFHLPIDITPRIVFHEITEHAVRHAIDHPRIIDMNLVKAQHARQILDMSIGFKISPYLWKYIYSSKSASLSAGRCQTPALRLVYDNEMEKKSTDILDYKYKTTALFFSHLTPFSLNHEFTTKEQVEHFLDISKSQTHTYTLHVCSDKESVKSHPKPFNTSRLLQTASNIMHSSPKETMQLLQTLYQDGYITYMRTESTKYSNEFIQKATGFIEKEWNSTYIGNVDVLRNKSTNNPHEAIRVTKIECKMVPIVKGNTRLSTLYKIIWKNTIQSCMSPAIYKCTPIEISAPMNYKYIYSVESPVFLGWQVVSTNTAFGDDSPANITEIQSKNESMLLFYKTIQKTGQTFSTDLIESTLTVHSKHSHYTESTLIQKLEEIGIGRPSTFSLLVDTIQDRGYVKKTNVPGISVNCIDYKLKNNKIIQTENTKTFGAEKNKLVIQPIGILTIEFLIQYFQSIFSYEYSKNMEDELDKISNMEETDIQQYKWYSICQQCNLEIKELSKKINHLGKQTYPIDTEHSLAFQQYGPVIRKQNADGTFEYKSIKKDVELDLQKLKDGAYTLNDLLEIENSYLGTYKDIPVYIRSGQYGAYIEYQDEKHNIRSIDKPLNSVRLEDILHLLDPEYTSPANMENDGGENGDSSTSVIQVPSIRKPPPPENKNILRVITSDMSIRKGKFGAYVYYKRSDMKNPEFYSLKKFTKGFNTCDIEELKQWICTTYKITIT
jgi:DNA topoisomerase-1